MKASLGPARHCSHLGKRVTHYAAVAQAVSRFTNPTRASDWKRGQCKPIEPASATATTGLVNR